MPKPARSPIAAVAVLLLAAAPATAGEVRLPGSLGGVAVGVESMREARFRGVVEQQFDFSCGSASVATILTFHYDMPTSEDDALLGMFEVGDRAAIEQRGFSLLEIKRYFEARGLRANGYEESLDTLQRVGIPAIALIDLRGYRHFVVIKGVTDEAVLVGDPAHGLDVYPRTEFESMWNGVLFVVEDRQDQGRRNFGRDGDWRVTPQAPLGTPLHAQALSLASWMLRGPTEF